MGDRNSTWTKYRIEKFRSIKLSAKVWIWGLMGAILFVVVFQSMFVVTFRLFEYQPDAMLTFVLGDLSLWMLWMTVVASAFIAGVT